jgi:UMF1 family MFS transporter
MEKNQIGVMRSWVLYDWANSVYSLIITSTLFPVFFSQVARGAGQSHTVLFLGWQLQNSALYSFAVSFSFLVAAALSPLLSAWSDMGGYRKRLLLGFCLLGSISCAGLYFFEASGLEWGMALFCLAAVGFSGSVVFYNSFLPEIATPDRYEQLSARGFAMGYIGSVILLVCILSPLFLPGAPADPSGIFRVGFVATGLWWLVFGTLAVSGLPAAGRINRKWAGPREVFARITSAFRASRNIPGLFRFLGGYFFMNLGVQTIMYLAAVFGEVELEMDSVRLIATILILQLVAILGSLGFARVSLRMKPRNTLVLACLLWMVVCVWAFFVRTDLAFYGVAALVGLVMGGSQSMLRSTFTHFLPPEEHGKSTLYGFFDVLDKLSTVLGTLVFGLVNQLTGSMRLSALVLSVFFLLAALLFRRQAVGSAGPG